MANKIDNALDVIATTLTDAAIVKAVERGVVNPATVANPPVIGLVPSRSKRTGGPNPTRSWTTSVLMMVCTSAKGSAAGEKITELMADVEAALDGLPADGSLGANVEMEGWDFWYHAPTGGAVPVGAWAALKIETSGPLKVT